jgi:hypothetical protein
MFEAGGENSYSVSTIVDTTVARKSSHLSAPAKNKVVSWK